MRINELIRELEKIYDEKGDLPVNAFTDENYYVNFHLEVGVVRVTSRFDDAVYDVDTVILRVKGIV